MTTDFCFVSWRLAPFSASITQTSLLSVNLRTIHPFYLCRFRFCIPFYVYVYVCAFFRWTNITSVIESQKAMQTKWKELRENKTNKEITLAVTFEKFARTINALNRCWTHKNHPCLLHLYDLLICLTCGSVNFEYTFFLLKYCLFC